MSELTCVLVVEDEEHIRDILEYNLKMDGFDVYQAENGRKGLELVHQRMPDVILLDWMMPEMDGLEVLTELKKDERTKNIPVFMLTAKDGKDNVECALAKGASGYFGKPLVCPEILGQRIREALGKLVKN